MSDVDWSRYRKCPVCRAPLGQPCRDITGTVVDGRARDVAEVEAARPHSGRKLRAGR